jgi:hypothetical protein
MRGEEKREEEKREEIPDCAAEAAPVLPVPVKSEARSKRKPQNTELEFTSEHSRLIDHFETRYKAANQGRSPTWGGKPGKLLSELRKQHAFDEIKSRMDRLFDGRGPPFISASNCDFAGFVQHFDKLAVDTQPRLALVAQPNRQPQPFTPKSKCINRP